MPIAPLTSLGTGGSARYFVRAESDAEVVAALDWAEQAGHPVLLLGGGSNLVCSDSGFAGLVLLLAQRGRAALSGQRLPGRRHLRVAAGESWDAFVAACCAERLSGVECLSGIPGSVGATPIQNVGAYGQEVSETVDAVRCYDRAERRIVTLSNVECEFGYRSSRFKTQERDRFVVLSVDFVLQENGPAAVLYPELQHALGERAEPSLDEVRAAVLRLRASKSMLLDRDDENGRSCGSFFVNVVLDAAELAALETRAAPLVPPRFPQPDGRFKIPAAWLIQHAGFDKGHRRGPVGLSTKHTLCVVAHDGATSADVVAFARHLCAGVELRFGVRLEPEPTLIGITW